MATPMDNFASRLGNFGSLTGLRFTPQGGRAVVFMGTSEVGRFLDALTEIESNSLNPDAELLAALKRTRDRITERILDEKAPLYEIEAEVVIAGREVRLEPVLSETLPDQPGKTDDFK